MKDIGFKLHNRFDIEVIDSRTGKVKQKAQAENVILNQWWSQLEAGHAPNYALAFGSGSGTPAVTDTALFHYEGTLNTIYDNSFIDSWNGIAWYRKKVTLNEQQQVGKTFSEIGIITSGNVLTTHAMLEDMNGNPVTITKTDVDIMHIYSTVYTHWTSVNRFFHRSSSLGEYVQWGLGLNWGPLGMTLCYNKSAHYQMLRYSSPTWGYVFDPTNKRLTISGNTNRVPVESGNGDGTKGGGIGYIVIGDTTFIMPVEDFYLGDDIEGEAVGTGDGSTTRFYTKIDMPENAKVYVDGVLQSSGVIVRKCGGYSDYPGRYISCLYHKSTSNKQEYYANSFSEVVRSGYTGGMTIYYERVDLDFVGLVFKNDNYISGFDLITRVWTVYYNDSFYHTKVYGSNDLNTWNLIHETSDFTPGGSTREFHEEEITLDSTTGHYKYYRMVCDGTWEVWKDSLGSWTRGSSWFTADDGKQIIFDNPPANGAVITVDYHTPWIAKDSDHVLDFGSYTLSYGPYSE